MRRIKDLFIEEYWTIAFKNREDGAEIYKSDGNIKKRFHVYKPSLKFWLADPFFFEREGKVYLFYELFSNIKGRGVIAFSVLKNGIMSAPKVVLEKEFHLSYPLVFKHDGDIYMLPETCADNKVQLFKAISFPEKWEPSYILLDEVKAVDSTLFDDGNTKWMFSALPSNGGGFNKSLMLYRVDGRGLCLPHVQNPVASGMDVRPGGNIFKGENGKFYRPSQIAIEECYGSALIFKRIEALSEKEYIETDMRVVKPEFVPHNSKRKAFGIHSYALSDQYEAVDLKFKRLNLFKTASVLFSKTKRKVVGMLK